jgi:hypothetical protein
MLYDKSKLYPLAAALLILVGAGIALYSSAPSQGVFSNVLTIALGAGLAAAWFGYGAALMFKGVVTNDGGYTMIGGVVVLSAVAAPYLIFVSGVLSLLK